MITGAALVATGLAFACFTLGLSLFLCLIGFCIMACGCCARADAEVRCHDCERHHRQTVEIVVEAQPRDHHHQVTP